MKGVLSLLSGLVLIVVILLTSIELNIFNLSFFRAEYAKLDSTRVIGISDQELTQTTQGLLAYIKGDRDNLSIQATIKGEKRQVFNEREIKHMVDVRDLYTKAHWVRNTGAAVLIILLLLTFLLSGKKFLRLWAKGYLAGAAICLCLSIVLAGAIMKDFTGFWDKFHLIFFSNDLWQLNPETDILIQIVPEQFFYDLVVRILSFFAAGAAIMAILGGIILKKRY